MLKRSCDQLDSLLESQSCLEGRCHVPGSIERCCDLAHWLYLAANDDVDSGDDWFRDKSSLKHDSCFELVLQTLSSVCLTPIDSSKVNLTCQVFMPVTKRGQKKCLELMHMAAYVLHCLRYLPGSMLYGHSSTPQPERNSSETTLLDELIDCVTGELSDQMNTMYKTPVSLKQQSLNTALNIGIFSDKDTVTKHMSRQMVAAWIDQRHVSSYVDVDIDLSAYVAL